MLDSIIGKKVGMTQLFTDEGKVVPVTVIDVANSFVTQIKTPDRDGYAALQLGLLKKKYREQGLQPAWLSDKSKYFSVLQEVKVDDAVLGKIKLGQSVKVTDIGFQEKNLVKVTGKSKGLGFQGVMRRWGFAGGPGSHGSNFHRKPGSIGNMCSQGNVVKGKKLPGRQGYKQITVDGLSVIRLDSQSGCVFVKGAVPGKKDSLLILSKQG